MRFEIATEQGQYHQLKIRYSPAIGDPCPTSTVRPTPPSLLPFTDRVGLAPLQGDGRSARTD
jgi:hypothetical protein